MDNIAFTYTTKPLEMAESMAFNLDCLGCICWFEYGKVSLKPGVDEPGAKDVGPFIRFFHKRRDLLRDAAVLADVAVLRSFPSMMYGSSSKVTVSPSGVEQSLILARIPFQIIFDQHLGDLKRYRLLILPGCAAMSDQHIAQVTQYVKSGGRLLLLGLAAIYDEWLFPRAKPGLDEIAQASGAVRVGPKDSVAEAVRKLLDGGPTVDVAGPAGLCAEFTQQADRRLVHLVNYRSDGPAQDVRVRLRLPAGKKAKSVVLAGPRHEADTDLPFEQDGQVATFTVPAVDVYEIAVAVFR
jgi:hypothetical protein